jgi:hypothetical protein|tara:strand:+ start:598 stop:834 length:237 start_codon:yes stop_codon:yes gene_type:complete
MQTVNLKIRLELDDNEMRVDWIKEAIQECLLEDLGERITIFHIVATPPEFTMELNPTTEYDESDDIEDVKTITAYGED